DPAESARESMKRDTATRQNEQHPCDDREQRRLLAERGFAMRVCPAHGLQDRDHFDKGGGCDRQNDPRDDDSGEDQRPELALATSPKTVERCRRNRDRDSGGSEQRECGQRSSEFHVRPFSYRSRPRHWM